MVYLDYAAKAPISDRALHTYIHVSKEYLGNSSSLHDAGSKSASLLELCRKELASIIHGDWEGVYFTGGGSESNYLAIASLARASQHRGRHLITSEIEHPSVIHTFNSLKNEGFEVTHLPVASSGVVKLDELQKALRPDTILVSIGHVNSEIGTVQPIAEIGEMLLEKQVLFHSDCVQSFAKIPLSVKDMRLHSVSLSSHKAYGPIGVGACYISPDVRWTSILPGTTQEKGFRAGTINVPGIAGFIAAAEETLSFMEREDLRLRLLGNSLLSAIRSRGWEVIKEGHPTLSLANILGLRFPGIEGQFLMLELNRYGIAVSSSTACQAGQQNPSRTLLAMGRSITEARELIRVSLGRWTSKQDMEKLILALDQILKAHYNK